MPYSWSNKHIKLGKYDRRLSKLTDEDREYIIYLHKKGEISDRAIARLYADKCSRRLVIFIIYPERLKVLQDRNKENQHWKKYYDRKKFTDAKKNWDHYKNNLIKNKII